MIRRVYHALRWLVILAISMLLLLFAVNNHASVTVSLLPLPYEAEAPLFLYIMLTFICGVLTGGLLLSAQALRWRRRYGRETKRAEMLNNELTAMRAKVPSFPLTAA